MRKEKPNANEMFRDLLKENLYWLVREEELINQDGTTEIAEFATLVIRNPDDPGNPFELDKLDIFGNPVPDSPVF